MAQQRPELVMNHPQLITRDEQGNIVSILFQPINANAKLSEILDTSLQYSFESAYGQFTPRIGYARILATTSNSALKRRAGLILPERNSGPTSTSWKAH